MGTERNALGFAKLTANSPKIVSAAVVLEPHEQDVRIVMDQSTDAAAFNIDLPPVESCAGQVFAIKMIAQTSTAVAAYKGVTIRQWSASADDYAALTYNGGPIVDIWNVAVKVLKRTGDVLVLMSTGTSWVVLADQTTSSSS